MSEWSRSAGFGGTAAIVAATIAYRAARAGARRQQWVDRKVQWWARARWALERALSDDLREQEVGLDMLDALGRSEWAGEHEADLIDVVVTRSLGHKAPPARRGRPRDARDGARRAGRPPSDSPEEVGP